MSHIFRNFKSIFFCLVFMGYGLSFAQTNPPQRVNFQGRLTDLSDNPLNGSYSLTFSLYNAPTGGASLWTETQAGVSIVNGAVESLLGSVTPIPYSVSASSSVYLEIRVGAEVLSPRQPFSSVLYAMNTYQLAGKTYDTFVDTSTAQTINGIKTFSANPVFNAGAIGQASVSGLPAALATVAAATATLKAQIDGISGDNFGNHTATTSLNMANFSITNVNTIVATNSITAGNFIGNGSGLTGISGDDLGNHTATANLNMAGRAIVSAGTVTAVNFVGSGAALTGISGDNLGNHTAAQGLNMAGFGILNVSSISVTNFITAAGINVGTVTASIFSGNGSGLTGVIAANVPAAGVQAGSLSASVVASSLSVNSVSDQSIVSVSASKLTGALPAINGSALTGIAGDNLGNHTATQQLNMGPYSIISSGTIAAVNFIGSGSGLSGIPGDNLGSHVAATSLNMANFPINNVSTLTAVNFVGNGYGLSGVTAANVPAAGVQAGSLSPSVVASSVSVNSVTDQAIVSVSAWKLTGALPAIDGAALTGIAGDNLGNHTATQQLNMGPYSIISSGTITAVNFIGNGSGLSGIPGDNLGSHVAATSLNMANFPINNVSTIAATNFAGNGSGLTGVIAANVPASGVQPGSLPASVVASSLSVNSVSDQSIVSVSAYKLTGALPAISGAALTGISGDNLGTHTAAANLNMSSYSITNALSVNAGSLVVGMINASGTVTALSYYGDGSGLTGIAGDNLGDHTATQALNMGGYAITNASSMTVNGDLIIGPSNPVTFTIGAGAGDSFITAPGNQSLTIKATREEGLGNAFQIQTYNAAKNAFLDRFTVTGATDTAKISILNSNFALAHGAGVMNKVFLDGTINDGAVKRVVSLANTDGSNYGGYLALGNASSPLTGPANGATVLLSGAPNQNSYISVGNVGIGTTAPVAKLYVAGGIVATSSITAQGGFFGNGAGLSGISGDNLGNHTATMALNMATFDIVGVSTITVNGNVGIGTSNPAYRLVVSSGAGEAGVMFAISTGAANVITMTGAGAVYANKYYGDGSSLTGIASSADNLGNHTATQNIRLGDYWISRLGSDEGIRISTAGNIGIGKFPSSTYASANLHISSVTTSTDQDMLKISTGAANADVFVVKGSGNVGIGTASPMTSLDVVGSITASASYKIAGSTVLAILPGTGSLGVGVNAGNVNTGANNSFVGYNAGYLNETGINNSFMGYNAGYNNTGSKNTFMGIEAGYSNVGGGDNVFIGASAGYSNLGGANNTFVGGDAGKSNTSASDNAFFGFGAGEFNTGDANTFIGLYAGRYNTTALYNSIVGNSAGYNNTTGWENTITGADAAFYNQTGSANAIFGREAGRGVTGNSFSSSTLMGYRAGYGLTTGSDNILLGFQAGDNLTTGSRNIVIGYDQNATAPTISNELNIGGVIYGDLSAKTVAIPKYTTQAADSGVTLTSADFGKTITVSASGLQTVTLPSVSASDIGAQVTVVKLGIGQVTIQAVGATYIVDSTPGGTIYNDSTGETYASITLRLATDTKWIITGGNGTWTTN